MATKEAQLENLYKEYYDILVKKYLCETGFIPPLYAYAEDVVQETFIEAINKWDEFEQHENRLGWLILTSRNKAKNLRKKHFFRSAKHAYCIDEQTDSFIEDHEARIERIAEKKEAAQHLAEILSLLSASEKEAIIDHYENGMTVPEMAQLYGKSETAITAAIRRARQKGKKFKSDHFSLIFFILRVSFSIFEK